MEKDEQQDKLRERLDGANTYLVKERKKLEELIVNYRQLSEQSHPGDILKFREQFTDFAAGLTIAIIESQRIMMQAEHESRQQFLSNFFAEKEKVGENSKVTSDEKARRHAEFKTARHYINENYAKINYTMAKELKYDSKLYIEEINQKIPVVKDEMFYSRQHNSIKS